MWTYSGDTHKFISQKLITIAIYNNCGAGCNELAFWLI